MLDKMTTLTIGILLGMLVSSITGESMTIRLAPVEGWSEQLLGLKNPIIHLENHNQQCLAEVITKENDEDYLAEIDLDQLPTGEAGNKNTKIKNLMSTIKLLYAGANAKRAKLKGDPMAFLEDHINLHLAIAEDLYPAKHSRRVASDATCAVVLSSEERDRGFHLKSAAMLHISSQMLALHEGPNALRGLRLCFNETKVLFDDMYKSATMQDVAKTYVIPFMYAIADAVEKVRGVSIRSKTRTYANFLCQIAERHLRSGQYWPAVNASQEAMDCLGKLKDKMSFDFGTCAQVNAGAHGKLGHLRSSSEMLRMAIKIIDYYAKKLGVPSNMSEIDKALKKEQEELDEYLA